MVKKNDNGKFSGKMRDYYRIYDLLGTGAFGEVRKCVFKANMKDKRSSLKSYRAVKILSKAYMEDKEKRTFLNEVRVMNSLGDHPSILKFHHYFEDTKRYMLITDICNGGELFQLMRERKKFETKEASIIVKQILSAVKYMHE